VRHCPYEGGVVIGDEGGGAGVEGAEGGRGGGGGQGAVPTAPPTVVQHDGHVADLHLGGKSKQGGGEEVRRREYRMGCGYLGHDPRLEGSVHTCVRGISPFYGWWLYLHVL
jgi:hypothetical protein